MSHGYHSKAKRIWRKAAWVHGDGPIAVIAYCNVTTVSLHANRVDAQHSIDFIDRFGCGHRCGRDHRVVDLADLVRAS